jgi:hypothetical protein
MKKILGILFFTLLLIPVNDVLAVRPLQNWRNEIKPTIRAIKEEVKPTIAAIREETKESIRLTITASPSAKPWEIRKEIKEKNKGLLEEIKNQAKEKLKALRFDARLTGKITEIGGNYIKVSDNKEGKIYQVNITEKTQLRRHFWGKSSLSEFSMGDEVNVIGRYTDETKSTIEAVLIRNKSIQKRWGVFFGEVTAKNSDNFVIKTINRGDLTVYFGSAKFVDNSGNQSSYDALSVGSRVRVKGVWDKDLKKISEVDEVKIFSKKVSLTPKPTKSENK